MPDCWPPRTTTAPMSTLILTFLAAASVPELDWLQVSLPCDPFASCASARGASKAKESRPTNCGKRFKMNTSVSVSRCHQRYSTKSQPRSINLRQLRQHGASLRLDVLALILG